MSNQIKRYIWLPLLLGGLFGPLKGQDLLKLDDAINMALEQNYGILVAKNDAQVAANNAHRGAAGLLPTVAASAGANYNNNNTKVEFATPAIEPVDARGVESNSLNAGINVNYTVFDGLGNVNTFRVLQRSASLSETQTQAVIEATVSQIGNLYYSIARLAESYRTLRESIEISRARLERAKNQLAFGGANKLAVLNAEVDLNTDSSSLAVAFFNLENAKRNLNALMGREVDEAFEVSSEVSFSRAISLEDIRQTAQRNNVNVRLAGQSQQIAALNLKVAKASYMPVVGVNAGYNYTEANNGPGSILLSQQNIGLTLGASINIPIFSANQRKVSVQV